MVGTLIYSKMKKTDSLIKFSKQEGGYVALISVVFISSLLMLLVSSFNLASMSELDMALKESQSEGSFFLAQACAEEGLIKLKEDLGYSGGEILSFESGTCTILPVEGGGNEDRVIKTSGSVENVVRRIKVVIDVINPEMQISSWEEVESF